MRKTKARIGMNPRTREPIKVKARKTVRFNAILKPCSCPLTFFRLRYDEAALGMTAGAVAGKYSARQPREER
jgi:hypothetical protein